MQPSPRLAAQSFRLSDGTPLDANAVKQNLDVLGLGEPDKQIVKDKDFINYDHSTVEGNVVKAFSGDFEGPELGTLTDIE